MANVTVKEFVEGETLEYRTPAGRRVEATYRVGEGVYLESRGKDLGCVPTDDVGVRRIYWNVTGGADGEEEEED